MIYGRRIKDYGKDVRGRSPSASKWYPKFHSFRLKYSLYLFAALGGAAVAFIAPAWYFVSQNYEIFSKLAYDTQPELEQHLERELSWLAGFALISLVSLFAFTFYIGLKVTDQITGPLKHLDKHFSKVTMGDWSQKEFPIQDADDFYEFMDSYAYMYRTLRANTESEIELLEKMVIDPRNRETLAIWKSLIQAKRNQLNLPESPILIDVSSDEAAEKRRVS